MIRDSQKSSLYAAERLLWDIFDRCAEHNNPMVEIEHIQLTLPPEGKFADITSIQRRCDQVCDAMNVPHVRVEAHRNKNIGGDAFYQHLGMRLVVPDGRKRWAMRELVVLHELAHHVTDCQQPLGLAAHGPEFVANYIRLLETVMAPEAGLAARLVYVAHGVKEGVSK
jgi:putative metallohydrolase (TIGR04338 family)